MTKPIRSIIISTGLVIAAGQLACDDPPVYRATVCLTVEHHGLPLEDVAIYRAGGGDYIGFPYDMLAAYDTVVYTGLSSEACFRDLGLGAHHFAALGYDPLIRDSVLGTLSLDLTVRKRMIDTVLNVSEVH